MVELEGETWDLNRPLEGDCTVTLFDFDSPLGKETFWHSSSHLLGSALENIFGAKLTHGPPLKSGFFYDGYVGKEVFSNEDYKTIQGDVKK